MKLKTSFFNDTVFRKNITRFAPVWALYTLCLLMGLMVLADNGSDYWVVSNMAQCIQVMPSVNLCYALICGMVLFGDLYNSRLCNALHAMPLRREGWFITNVVSGLLFSLVPSLIMTVLAIPLCAMSVVTHGWQVALYWLLGNNLQFIAFFGIAVFSAFCVGSRFAMAVVYALLNFGSVMAYWMVDTLYTPLLYGVSTNVKPFADLCPVVRMIETEYIECEAFRGGFGDIIGGRFTVTDGWGLLWMWAAVGILLAAVGLELYRRRKLESAGDFLAVKSMEPVFLVIYTLAVGVSFHFLYEMFIGGKGILWLFVGLIAGWFTGLMLLQRTVRVLRKKTVFACVGLMAAVAASLLIPAFDLLGIESWIPEKEEVKSVTIYSGHYAMDYLVTSDHVDCVYLTEDADIEKVLDVHERALDEKGYFSDWETTTYSYHYYEIFEGAYTGEVATLQFTLRYELTDGRIVHRYYYTYVPGETAEILRPWFSSLSMILGIEESQIPEFVRSIGGISLDGHYITEELTDEELEELLEAIALDCREGNMAQRWAYHGEYEACSLEFESLERDEHYYWYNVNVYEDSEHTIQWLIDHGFDQYMYMYNEDLYY